MRSEYGRGNPLDNNKRLAARRESPRSKLFGDNKKGQVCFERMFAEHAKDLTHYLTYAGAGHEAEDLVQETFIGVAQKLADKSIPADANPLDLKVYLFNQARNASLDRIQAKKSEVIEVEEEEANDKSVPSHEQSVVDRIIFQSAFDELPFGQQKTFILNIAGFTSPEVGKKVHLTPEGVRTSVFNARKKMRKSLNKMDES